MSCDFTQLATSGVQGLHPYQPGKPLAELEREYGIQNAIKLASNENPLGASPRAIAAIQAELAEITRYPDGNGFVLKQAIVEQFGVALNNITLGNGSNDLLELIARGFVSSQDSVLFSQHAFAVYPIVTQAIGAQAIITPAKNWGHDLNAMLGAIQANTRVIFIANPNNPTGTWLDRDSLLAFLRQVPSTVVVVLDEAYSEYVDEPSFPNGLELLAKFPNLVVTRTFSKAYGLASLRVGYAAAAADITNVLNRVRQPFNVNSFALAAAAAALRDQEYLQQSVALNRAGMAQLTAGFAAMGLDYIPSVGNFVTVDVGQIAAPVYENLLREGVIVRPIANYGMPQHLRISIGKAEENQRFLEALKKVLGRS